MWHGGPGRTWEAVGEWPPDASRRRAVLAYWDSLKWEGPQAATPAVKRRPDRNGGEIPGSPVAHTPGSVPVFSPSCASAASTYLQKYDDVCWERDGDQIEARRRVDARASARRNNKEMGPSRPNPAGGRGLRAISLSFVVNDTTASPPPLFATSPRKPHPQTLSYFCK